VAFFAYTIFGFGRLFVRLNTKPKAGPTEHMVENVTNNFFNLSFIKKNDW